MVTAFLLRFAAGRALKRVSASLPWQIWALLAGVVFLGASGWYIDRRAYTRGSDAVYTEWEQAGVAEMERLREANAAARRVAADEIARLNEAKEVRDATIERLEREASEDPNADTPVLGVNSVRRLNQVD